MVNLYWCKYCGLTGNFKLVDAHVQTCTANARLTVQEKSKT